MLVLDKYSFLETARGLFSPHLLWGGISFTEFEKFLPSGPICFSWHGSPDCGPWPTSGPLPIGHQATWVAGQCRRGHSPSREHCGHSQPLLRKCHWRLGPQLHEHRRCSRPHSHKHCMHLLPLSSEHCGCLRPHLHEHHRCLLPYLRECSWPHSREQQVFIQVHVSLHSHIPYKTIPSFLPPPQSPKVVELWARWPMDVPSAFWLRMFNLPFAPFSVYS